MLAIAILVGLSGCATESRDPTDTTTEIDEPVDDSWEDEPVDESWNEEPPEDEAPADELSPETDVSARWTCNYSPTMDNNWHNDVLCTNGSEQDRPYLREGDSFITETEIMDSAREYEDQLNGE